MGSRSQRPVLPSMSVKRKVTVPEGRLGMERLPELSHYPAQGESRLSHASRNLMLPGDAELPADEPQIVGRFGDPFGERLAGAVPRLRFGAQENGMLITA